MLLQQHFQKKNLYLYTRLTSRLKEVTETKFGKCLIFPPSVYLVLSPFTTQGIQRQHSVQIHRKNKQATYKTPPHTTYSLVLQPHCHTLSMEMKLARTVNALALTYPSTSPMAVMTAVLSLYRSSQSTKWGYSRCSRGEEGQGEEC